MNVLDLFSGIGGFSLGLERAGMRTVAFCEIDPFARRVLAKHWPNVPCYDDVRSLTAGCLASDGIAVDVICGGFPCQDISAAGRGAGLEGERSGLWFEYARLIGELRPSFVIVENVSALLSRGLDRVLGDMASLGYDAEWHCIPASAVGAPHQRDRVWIVGNTNGLWELQSKRREPNERGRLSDAGSQVADADSIPARGLPQRTAPPLSWSSFSGQDVAHANSYGCGQVVPSILGRALIQRTASEAADSSISGGWRWWESEPDVGRVAHGIPGRVDRLRQLGNSVVPQIPEIIGRAIMTALTSQQRNIGE